MKSKMNTLVRIVAKVDRINILVQFRFSLMLDIRCKKNYSKKYLIFVVYIYI